MMSETNVDNEDGGSEDNAKCGKATDDDVNDDGHGHQLWNTMISRRASAC